MPGELEVVVINTGPVISLGRAGLLDLIGKLAIRFVMPSEVAEEITAGADAGHPVRVPEWVAVERLGTPVTAVALHALDRGEAAVIQLALDRDIRTVCIDEWRGRRAARASGLSVTGSLGLIGRAKREGHVAEVRPLVERLSVEGAFYHPELLRRFLEAVDEA